MKYNVLPGLSCQRTEVLAMDLSDLRQRLSTPGHTLYEYMKHDTITKIYLDFDADLDTNGMAQREASDYIRKQMEHHEYRVRAQCNIIRDCLTAFADGIDYKVATRHGPKASKPGCYKLSYRPYFTGVKAHYTSIPDILKHMCGQDDAFWDFSVYKEAEQLYGCINGSKSHQDPRVLKPEKPEDDVLDYVAQHTESTWPILYPLSGSQAAASPSEQRFENRPITEATQEIANVISKDPGLCKHLRVSHIAFRSVNHDDTYNTTEMYVNKRCGTWCPIAMRVHASNNCTINVLHQTKPKVLYHCFDDECCRRARSLDVTPHVTCMQELQAAIGHRDLLVPKHHGQDVTDPHVEYITQLMQSRWPHVFSNMPQHEFRVVDSTPDRISFAWGPINGHITRNTSVIDGNGNFLGMLVPDQLVTGSMTYIHKDIPVDGNRCIYNQVDCQNSVLKSIVPHADYSITLVDISNCKTIVVKRSGKSDIVINNRKKIKELQEQIATTTQLHIANAMGPSFFNVFHINIINNNGNIIIETGGRDAEEGETHHEVIVDQALANNPDVFGRIRFVPDMKTNNCNGIFHCDPVTNIWKRRTNTEMEQLMLETLKADNSFTVSQRNCFCSKRGRAEVLYCIASRMMDVDFRDKLNANPYLFPCSNGVLDLNTKMFRPIEMEDYIKTTCGWAYDPDLAHMHRAEVEDFLHKLFPVEAERNTFMTYLASLLSGERRLKKFAVMTDKRSGDNGKSTFVEFICRFFGALATEHGKKILNKSRNEGDRNSHDAGLEFLRDFRLIIADEMDRDHRFDMGFLKTLTSGTNAHLEGRSIGTGETFKFVIRAGVILIFNEGQCPQFDADDEAFLKRMLVVPMRSRFTRNAHMVDEPYTYEIQPKIDQKFRSWLPAFADILLDYYSHDPVLDVPHSMTEWQNDLAVAGNAIADFLETHVEVTGNKNDMICRDEVYSLYHSHQLTKRDFNRLYKSYFTKLHDAKYIERSDVGGKKNVSGIVRGVRMKVDVADENAI